MILKEENEDLIVMIDLLHKKVCPVVSLRTACLICGWYDIIYGHFIITVYIVAFYTGYSSATGESPAASRIYNVVLSIDFSSTAVQLLGGIFLVYGVEKNKPKPVLLYSRLGLLLVAADVVGDVLLGFSFPDVTTKVKITAATFLVAFIAIRAYMSWCALSYYKHMINDQAKTSQNLHSTISPIVQRHSI